MTSKRNRCCALCGAEITCKKLRVPRKCEKCGASFDVRTDIGFVIYFIVSLLFMAVTLCIIKIIIKDQWFLYSILALEIITVPNIVERKLFQTGIMKYKNLY